jgi:hypothetical protein
MQRKRYAPKFLQRKNKVRDSLGIPLLAASNESAEA